MGHRHQHSHAHAHGSPDTDTADPDPTATGGTASHTHTSSGFLMNLVGFDRFTRGKAVDGLARAGKAANPFDLGIYRNCRDFWTKGRELGVEYERLYDVPMEGFEEARRRREREEDMEDGGSGPRKGGRGGLFMGLGMGRAGSSRGGYEPISQV
jgi:palmitoyltransferase